MIKTPLAEYLSLPGNSQESLAAAIGYRQSAISNMLKAKRQIYVITYADQPAVIELLEEKKIGCASAA